MRPAPKAKVASERTTMPSTTKPGRKSKAKEGKVTEPIPAAVPEEEIENEEDEDEEDEEDEDEEDEDENVEDDEEDDDAEDDEEEGVLLSDLDSDAQEEDMDIVPYQKLHKDNHAALTQALSTFALPLDTLPFHVHQSFTSPAGDEVDVNDDLNRELAFYKQALGAVQEGRKRLLAEGIPFSRPADYFAEMIKDDEHMDKVFYSAISLCAMLMYQVKERIVVEEAGKKASKAAKRQRDLKKFGKSVQVQKLQERQKEKRSTLEKIKTLKKSIPFSGSLANSRTTRWRYAYYGR